MGIVLVRHIIYLLSFDKSTHMRIPFEFILGVTTIGAYHSVGSVTGAMIPCMMRRFMSFFSFSLYARETVLVVVMQNRLVLSVNDM